MYTFQDIERIVGFTTWSDRQKYDELMRIDTEMYCNLGTDSTKAEREEVKRKSRVIYRLVRDHIYPEIGRQFLNSLK